MAKKVIDRLEQGTGKFLIIGDRAINVADLSGVFTDKDVPVTGASEIISGSGEVKQLNRPVEDTGYSEEKYEQLFEEQGKKIEL